MMNYETFHEIIRGSVEYRIQGTVLTLTGYYTGKQVKLDLSRIDPDMFKELTEIDEDDGEDW